MRDETRNQETPNHGPGNRASATPPGFADHPDYSVGFEPCAKRVRVMLGGEMIADSTRFMLMRETRHIPVYYFPRDDVRMDLLPRTETRTRCPYEGEAVYWLAEAGGARFEDTVWSYSAPVHECARIKDYLCFFSERVDAVFVDGMPVEKPVTKWSAG